MKFAATLGTNFIWVLLDNIDLPSTYAWGTYLVIEHQIRPFVITLFFHVNEELLCNLHFFNELIAYIFHFYKCDLEVIFHSFWMFLYARNIRMLSKSESFDDCLYGGCECASCHIFFQAFQKTDISLTTQKKKI